MRRRELLAVAGAAVTAGCGSGDGEPAGSGTATDTVPRETPGDTSPEASPFRSVDDAGSEFDRTVDVVADLGCSSDGERPCTDALSDAVDDGVLLWFPSGRYRFDRPLVVRDLDRVGFAGPPFGDARLLPAEGFAEPIVDVADVGHATFWDVDVGVAGPRRTAGLRFITDRGFDVANVTYHGRGTFPAEQVPHAFFLAVRNPDGRGTLRNAVARHGSAIGHYKNGNGRGGVWIGPAHRGVAVVEDCEFAEFGNNGMYTSRNAGDVRVRGGTFRNNNVCGVRLSGAGSWVRDATIEVDVTEYDGPTTRLKDAFRTRGVVVEQGPFDEPPGVVVRDCSVAVRDSPNPGPAVGVWPTGKTVTVAGSHLRVDGDAPVVDRQPRTRQGAHAPSTGAREVRLDDVAVTGTASGRPAVQLADAPGSVVAGSAVTARGQDRDGIELARSPGTLVDGGRVGAKRYPLALAGDGDADAGCRLILGSPPALSTALDGVETARISLSAWPAETVSGTLASAGRYACLDVSRLPSGAVPDGVVGVTAVGRDWATVTTDPEAGDRRPGATAG